MITKLKQYSKLWAILFSLLGITLIFFGGMFSSNTKIEKIAEYATNITINQTKNMPLCALTIGKTKDSGSLLDPDSEFHNTYGTFMQQRIAFASAVNPDKEFSIYFKNIKADNLSLLYGGAVGSVSYNNHFKHNTLPIELMFSDERIYDISNYVIYISQEHADSLLDNYNIPRQEDGFHTIAEYESLLKQLIPISINDNVSDFVIQNIYFQNNYYYDGLFEVMGDFAIFSYYLPDNLRDEQKNIYFMDEYFYHNKYFMKYINAAYSSSNYSLKLNHFNIEGQIDDDYLLSFYYTKNANNFDWVSVLFTILATVLLLVSLFLLFFVGPEKKKTLLYSCLHLGLLFTPYILFSLIYRITGNICFLSETASKTNTYIILIYVVVYILFSLYGRRLFINNKSLEKEHHEINI